MNNRNEKSKVSKINTNILGYAIEPWEILCALCTHFFDFEEDVCPYCNKLSRRFE